MNWWKDLTHEGYGRLLQLLLFWGAVGLFFFVTRPYDWLVHHLPDARRFCGLALVFLLLGIAAFLASSFYLGLILLALALAFGSIAGLQLLKGAIPWGTPRPPLAR